MRNLATRTTACPAWCTANHDTPGWHHASESVDTPHGSAWITDAGNDPRIFHDTNVDAALSSMSITETLDLISKLGALVVVALGNATQAPAASVTMNA